MISFFKYDNDLFHTKIVSRSTRACIPPFIFQVVSYTCGKDFFSKINLTYKNRQDNDILIRENRVFSKHVITNMFNLEGSPAKSHPNKYTNKIIMYSLLQCVCFLIIC